MDGLDGANSEAFLRFRVAVVPSSAGYFQI